MKFCLVSELQMLYREVVDEEGWVHSGDLGRVDQDGFFFVCGRMKEILITGA